MNSRAIAELLVNGNISAAREAIIASPEAPIMALDVAEDLAQLHPDPPSHAGTVDAWYHAVGRVRRCLRGFG